MNYMSPKPGYTEQTHLRCKCCYPIDRHIRTECKQSFPVLVTRSHRHMTDYFYYSTYLHRCARCALALRCISAFKKRTLHHV